MSERKKAKLALMSRLTFVMSPSQVTETEAQRERGRQSKTERAGEAKTTKGKGQERRATVLEYV